LILSSLLEGELRCFGVDVVAGFSFAILVHISAPAARFCCVLAELHLFYLFVCI
jgi:hypothetical protein